MARGWLKRILVALCVAAMVPPAVYAASQNVVGTVNSNISFSQTASTGFITSQTFAQAIVEQFTYPNGTGSGQVDQFYAKQITLSATPTVLDLTNLTDVAGNTINLARVREFIVQVVTTTANFNVKVYATAGGSGWATLPISTDTNYLYARYGSVLRISDRYSTGGGNGNVTGVSNKSVTIDPGSNTIVVNILIVGCSAA